MGYVSALLKIQDIIGAVTGIRAAPDYAPDSVKVYPTAIVLPGSGTYELNTTGEMKALHNPEAFIFVGGSTDLPKVLEAAYPVGDAVAKALLADTSLGATADTFASLAYVFGPIVWGGMEHIGWTFTINELKIRSNL
jgi:hypothetical protein